MNKKGDLLIENIVFIVLNVMFLAILVLFLLKQGQGAVLMEDAYSKQIALLIDSARPGTIMKLNMEKGYEISQENGVSFDEVVSFRNNYVYVKLTDKGGDRYHYFSDVEVNAYPDSSNPGIYVITVSEKNE